MSLSSIGLLVITGSWLIQFFKGNKSKQIDPLFIATYMFGITVLVIDGFLSGAVSLILFNLCSLVAAGLVLKKIS